MKRTEKILKDRSREFNIEELFFSTTDVKGVITGCNEVFVRVSAYSPDEILGRPHNIIRHPQMPRCVFMLLWEYLLSNKSIGAYVKNLASTGEYYWVFALATPIDGGFLSIRLKPTSPILGIIEKLYPELLAHEESFGDDWRSGMRSAAKLLMDKLVGLGFETYDDFMTHALRTELNQRQESIDKVRGNEEEDSAESSVNSASGDLSRKIITIFGGLDDFFQLRSDLQKKKEFLNELVDQIRRVALNSGVRATHLGDVGRALGAVGEEIARVSGEIKREVGTLNAEVQALSSALHLTAFNICLASLQLDMIRNFAVEQSNCNLSEEEQTRRYGSNVESIKGMLDNCATESVKKAYDGLSSLRSSLLQFQYFIDFLGKILMTIQFAYVTGKTQSARVPGGEKFAILLDDLVDLAGSARGELETLSLGVNNIHSSVESWTLK